MGWTRFLVCGFFRLAEKSSAATSCPSRWREQIRSRRCDQALYANTIVLPSQRHHSWLLQWCTTPILGELCHELIGLGLFIDGSRWQSIILRVWRIGIKGSLLLPRRILALVLHQELVLGCTTPGYSSLGSHTMALASQAPRALSALWKLNTTLSLHIDRCLWL